MKRNKLLLYFLLTTGLFAGYSQAETKLGVSIPSFAVTDVQIGAMAGDTKASEFSTIITFNYTGVATSDWKFGFYMPRTFNNLKTVKQDINQRLTMQICKVSDPTKCANLVYLKTPITEKDLSSGYTNILGADKAYQLEAGQQYQLKLLHNDQWGVGNYDALPQNFFIISGNEVANNTPEKNIYHLLNYDAKAVAAGIVAHNATNWTNSSNVKPMVNIVPSPVNYTAAKGSFTLANGVVIHNQLNTDNTVASFFATDLAKDLSINATIDNKSARTGIIIKKITKPAEIDHNLEGYKIVITDKSIVIEAINNTGVLYALQSLRQLWNAAPTLANATIVDFPRFKYRGIEFDSARHFFPVAQVESFIDIMATHKLNTLHVHFADDEGFRLGLENYKEQLAKSANTRGYGNSTIAMMFIQGNLDKTNLDNQAYAYANTDYKGTYSTADIQQLVSYANQRGITIIPEIDLPGHARALIKAFPNELVDPNDTTKFIANQGYTDDLLPVCTYNTTTSVGPKFTPLINEIVTSTAKLFNNQKTLYAVHNEISVGGDEVSPGGWSNDSSCTGEWANLDSLGKSHKFFQLLSQSNPSLKISGWHNYIQTDESALGTNRVPATHAGHVWVWNNSGVNAGQAQAKTLAENGYKVVMAYSDQTYFDLAYTPDISEPGLYWAAPYLDTYSALHSAVAASQTINGIKKVDRANVDGIEATMFSENMPTYNTLVYMALPKMAGLSEASWSPASVTDNNNLPNWHSLTTRLGCGKDGFLSYLNSLYGVQYRGYPNGINLETPADLCK